MGITFGLSPSRRRGVWARILAKQPPEFCELVSRFNGLLRARNDTSGLLRIRSGVIEMASRDPLFSAALAVAASVSGAVTALETLAPMKRDAIQL